MGNNFKKRQESKSDIKTFLHIIKNGHKIEEIECNMCDNMITDGFTLVYTSVDNLWIYSFDYENLIHIKNFITPIDITLSTFYNLCFISGNSMIWGFEGDALFYTYVINIKDKTIFF